MPGPLTLALPRRCAGWVNKPAIRFHLADSENFFHYLNDALLPVLGRAPRDRPDAGPHREARVT